MSSINLTCITAKYSKPGNNTNHAVHYDYVFFSDNNNNPTDPKNGEHLNWSVSR